MTQHTPGPWHLDLRSGSLAIYPSSEINQHYCLSGASQWAIHYAEGKRATDGTHWTIDEVKVANARLIAAAPELLEALQEIVRLDARSSTEEGHKYDMVKAIKIAHAAIAKAINGL